MQVFETLFSWIRGVENSIMSIDEVLERAQDAVYRYGIRGLVIDPYNEMEHQRKSNQTETEYVSRLLSKVSPCCAFLQMCVLFCCLALVRPVVVLLSVMLWLVRRVVAWSANAT